MTTVVQISEKPEGVSFSLWEKDGPAKREPDRAKSQGEGRTRAGRPKCFGTLALTRRSAPPSPEGLTHVHT